MKIGVKFNKYCSLEPEEKSESYVSDFLSGDDRAWLNVPPC